METNFTDYTRKKVSPPEATPGSSGGTTTGRMDLPDYSSSIDSPTAKSFSKEIIEKGYTYRMGAKGERDSIDCSGAVCKVLKTIGVDRGNILVGNSAQHLHNDSKEVKPGEEKDGDLITMNVDPGSKKIDHIGFLVIDQKTGKKYIAESSASFNRGKIVPFEERLASLQAYAKSKNHNFEYHIRRL